MDDSTNKLVTHILIRDISQIFSGNSTSSKALQSGLKFLERRKEVQIESEGLSLYEPGLAARPLHDPTSWSSISLPILLYQLRVSLFILPALEEL